MISTEERVAYLVGRVEWQGQAMDNFKDDLKSFASRVDGRFDAFESRVDRRFDALESRFDRRFDALEAKMSRQFVWLVGICVTTLATVAAGFAAVASTLAGR